MWAAELFHLPHHLFDEPATILWPRLFIRTATLLTIWGLVHLTTARLLKRLHELENYLRVCSWCRKVGSRDEWLTIEEYFDTRFRTDTSHGICPACAHHQMNRHLTATRVEKAGTTTNS